MQQNAITVCNLYLFFFVKKNSYFCLDFFYKASFFETEGRFVMTKNLLRESNTTTPNVGNKEPQRRSGGFFDDDDDDDDARRRTMTRPTSSSSSAAEKVDASSFYMGILF